MRCLGCFQSTSCNYLARTHDVWGKWQHVTSAPSSLDHIESQPSPGAPYRFVPRISRRTHGTPSHSAVYTFQADILAPSNTLSGSWTSQWTPSGRVPENISGLLHLAVSSPHGQPHGHRPVRASPSAAMISRAIAASSREEISHASGLRRLTSKSQR